VRGMTDQRSNSYVEAKNGLLPRAKRTAHGFRTSKTFITVAYLYLSDLVHFLVHPSVAALAK
jgi:transposase